MTYCIYWDNGNACGTFPETYATEGEAQTAADCIQADNRAEGVWDNNGFCKVFKDDDNHKTEYYDEWRELYRAGPSHTVATGIGGLGLLGWRRKRKAHAGVV